MIFTDKEAHHTSFEFNGCTYDVMNMGQESESEKVRSLTALLIIIESLMQGHEVLIAKQMRLVIDSPSQDKEVMNEVDRIYNLAFEVLESELDLTPENYTLLMHQSSMNGEVEVNLLLIIGSKFSHLINDFYQLITDLHGELVALSIGIDDSYQLCRSSEKSVRSGVYKISEFAI